MMVLKENTNSAVSEKDCERADELMFLYIDGQVDGEEAAFLENHLAVCEACRKEFEIRKKLLRQISECDAAAPASLYPAVMEKIKQIPQPKRRLLPKHLLSLGAAAAACLIFAVCLRVPQLTSPDPVLPLAESGHPETISHVQPETQSAVKPFVPESRVVFETEAPTPFSPLETYSGEIDEELMNDLIEMTEFVAPRPREVATLTCLSSEAFDFLKEDEQYEKENVTFGGMSALVYTYAGANAESTFLALLGNVHDDGNLYIASRPDSEITSYQIILILSETIS